MLPGPCHVIKSCQCKLVELWPSSVISAADVSCYLNFGTYVNLLIFAPGTVSSTGSNCAALGAEGSTRNKMDRQLVCVALLCEELLLI